VLARRTLILDIKCQDRGNLAVVILCHLGVCGEAFLTWAKVGKACSEAVWGRELCQQASGSISAGYDRGLESDI
jgi:hypothetical protein